MVRSTRENSSSVDLGTLYSTAFVAIEAVEWRALRIARVLAGRPGGGEARRRGGQEAGRPGGGEARRPGGGEAERREAGRPGGGSGLTQIPASKG